MRRTAATLAALALALSACGDSTDDVDSVDEATATTESAPPIGGAAETAATDDMVFVHGTSNATECWWQDQSQTEGEDPTIEVIEGTLMCRSEMSDPRVSGVEEWEMTAPFFYTYLSGTPETGRFEATTTLETADGVWRGKGFGSDLWDADGVGLKTSAFAEYVGEGGYEGLLYRVWASQHPESDGYMLVGYITPIE